MDHTVAAISTATGEAGIGIVRMTGIDSFNIADKVFKGRKDKDFNRKMLYGHIYDKEELIDEVLIAYMKGPKTYTREDMVEIYTHGGMMSVRKVLDLLLKNGAEIADKGEFTKRAFLNGRLDLSQAEAVIDIIKSKTDKAYEASLHQLEGGLRKTIKKYRDQILELLSYVEYSINFTEDFQEELEYDNVIEKGEQILCSLRKLYDSANRGKIIREGVKTTIVGKPNVGKSSLLNALIRENKAIVTDIPGTTRDVIEEYIDIGGIALKITDTAGIRDTEDVVERIGVEKSLEFAQNADLIIAIFDASKELDEEDLKILDLIKDRHSIVVINKNDLDQKITIDELKIPDDIVVIKTSIVLGEGIEELERAIENIFYEGNITTNQDELITNVRHRDILKRVITSLESSMEDLKHQIPVDCVEVDLRHAWEALGEITGETIEDDVLDKIFSEFCIGK
ncbi:MAG: tRNA uridine-5-carboxymethylaminomethyl(34) synthesis GTPase MnmE [Tissierellia bacterium]|nr:tRNA uridine-5-carboxymethylaminomethyl(34) synthesis GTPase MnmE [Tissierellia bacterium]